MTYTLRFLPEVEDDAISGYSWYEAKAPDLAMNFFGCFMPASAISPAAPPLS